MTGPDHAAADSHEPERQYAEPVDPWATAEAAAVAAAGGSPPFPGSGAPGVHPASPHGSVPPGSVPPYSVAPGSVPPHSAEPWLASTSTEAHPFGASPSGAGRKAYRKPVFWLLAAAVVVVVGVASTLAVIFWPGHRALDFQQLAAADPVRLTPAVPVTSGFADTAVHGDRAYFASVSDDGDLGVVAADTESGKQLWASTKAGRATRWERMVALPDGVAVFTDTESATGKRRLAMLGAENGELLWDRLIDDDDDVLFAADVAVLVDRVEHRLLFLEINGKGKVRREQRNPRTDSGTSTAVVPVTTPADLSGPAGVLGAAAAPDLGDDPRIVQISADRSARVLNARTGEVVGKARQSVADPDDEVVAHNGRLIVRESVDAHRIVAYDLEQLGEPRFLYSAPDRDTQIRQLTPCGDDRICWVETTGYDAKTSRVAGLNAADGGTPWYRAVAGTESLVPVGDSVLAAQNVSPPTVTLLDPDGTVAWTHRGTVGRLDAGNVLLFSTALSTSPHDPSLAGRHLGDEQRELGPLRGVRSQTCSWNTSVIACVADEDFLLQRFTG